MTKRRLFIVDAMALAFRSYYAFNRPLNTSDGLPTQAVYGSLTFLLNLIEKEQPDYLLIATDSKEKTFRHEMYPEYKANRTDMPEDLAVQLPHLFKMFDALGCVVLKEAGLEADDLIGSITKQFAAPDLEIFMVSGDKDFMQLVNENTFLYSQRKGELNIIGPSGVEEKFGVNPSQIIDLLAIMGDSSDNVPGVAGIGPKGATQLLQDHGSLEAIYSDLDRVTNKRHHNALKSCKDAALLSQKLVTIKTDANIPYSLEDFACSPSHARSNQALLDLTIELEFKSMSEQVKKRLNQHSLSEDSLESTKQQDSQEGIEQNYHLVCSLEDLQECTSLANKQSLLAFDTETTGLDIYSDTPIGISLSWQEGHAVYIPLDKNQKVDLEITRQHIQNLLSNPKIKKIGHNLKFDLQMLSNIGIDVAGPFADSMIASQLLYPGERSHSLDSCCERELSYKKIQSSQLLGKSGTMIDCDINELGQYACEDADFTLRLYQNFSDDLTSSNLEKIFHDIEMPLIPVIAQMEKNGVFIDTANLQQQSEVLTKRCEELKKEIYTHAGEEFNIQSPKQLQHILFEKLAIHEELGVKRLKKTKSGFSTDVSVLEKLSAHPLPAALLEFRSLTKLLSTYINNLPTMVNPESTRLHASFHQNGTATGRMSSSEPNLQNIPVKSDLGRKIRQAFRAQSEHSTIVSADYSQVELRVLAGLSKDEGLQKAFKEDQDIHTSTAASIFGVSHDQVTSEQRSQAKAINFGIIYGMGAHRLARETGVSNKEASMFIEKYFEQYPGIKTYISRAVEQAKEHEYTETMLGRKRPLPEINSAKSGLAMSAAQNIAINSPVQGTAADIIKVAMVKIQKRLEDSKVNAKMLMQVHDELVFECESSQVDQLKMIVKDSMESAVDIGVPLKVSIGSGQNWLDAH